MRIFVKDVQRIGFSLLEKFSQSFLQRLFCLDGVYIVTHNVLHKTFLAFLAVDGGVVLVGVQRGLAQTVGLFPPVRCGAGGGEGGGGGGESPVGSFPIPQSSECWIVSDLISGHDHHVNEVAGGVPLAPPDQPPPPASLLGGRDQLLVLCPAQLASPASTLPPQQLLWELKIIQLSIIFFKTIYLKTDLSLRCFLYRDCLAQQKSEGGQTRHLAFIKYHSGRVIDIYYKMPPFLN